MKIIFAVGNPGREYENTRHNIGWLVADRIAEQCGAAFSKRAFHARVAAAEWEAQRVLLLKPQTYVNRVGGSAREVLEYYKRPPADMLVVTDDVNLPFGGLRLRSGGSAGGHNGLKSLIAALDEDFPRLRLGVGAPEAGSELSDYVLGPFRAEERARLDQILARALAAAAMWMRQGIDAAMNEFNGMETAEREPEE